MVAVIGLQGHFVPFVAQPGTMHQVLYLAGSVWY
jgi:hypothetical protein